MGNLTLNGATSGQITLAPTAVAGTNTITLPAATGTVLTTAGGQTVSGNTTVSGTVVMGSAFTMRNKIINGAMQFAQRGSGVAVTGTTSYYALDRFFAVVNGGTTGAGSKMYQSTTVPSNFQYSLKFGRESGGTSTNNPTIGQVIESANCYDMQGQTVTFSFYAKAGANYSASGSAFSVNLVTGTGTDQGSANIFGSWTGQVNNINNFTLTTSWQRFSFTASIGSTVTEIGFLAYYTPVGTAGADDYFYITGVQLEIGTAATPFEYRNYQQELAMCQRYFVKSFAIETAPTNGGSAPYEQIGTSYVGGYFGSGFTPFPVSMRTSPTMTYYSGNQGTPTNNRWQIYDGGWTNPSAFNGNTLTINGFQVSWAYSSATVKSSYYISGHFTASAEL